MVYKFTKKKYCVIPRLLYKVIKGADIYTQTSTHLRETRKLKLLSTTEKRKRTRNHRLRARFLLYFSVISSFLYRFANRQSSITKKLNKITYYSGDTSISLLSRGAGLRGLRISRKRARRSLLR